MPQNIRPDKLLTPAQKAALEAASGGPNPPTALNPIATMADISAGSGDVVGPAGAVGDTIPLFDGATGKLLKDSTVALAAFEPADIAIQGHIGTIGNPHGSTASDVGAAELAHDHGGVYEPADMAIQGHLGAIGNPHGSTASDVGAAELAHDHSGTYEPADSALQSHLGITDGNPHGTDYVDVGAAPSSHRHATGITGAVPAFTDDADLTGSVTGCTVYIYPNATFNGMPEVHTVAGADFSVTDNVMNYLVVIYNAGTPIYSITTDVSTINESNIIPINTILVTGGHMHFGHWDSTADGLANKLHRRFVKTQRHARESGLGLTVAAGVVKIDQGIVWRGAREFNLADTYSDGTVTSNWYFVYHVTGVWTLTTPNTKPFDYVNYDDGTDLVAMSNNNKFNINWVFRGVEDHAHGYVVLCNHEFDSLAEAQADTEVPPIPPLLSQHAILVGRIIFQKNISTPALIEGAFTYQYTGAVINTHNDLGGLDGGAPGEYFHLSSAELSTVNGHLSNTSNPHSVTATQVGLGNVANVAQVPLTAATDNHAPSGFIDRSTTTLSLVENVGGVNDTFQVTITGTNFPVYINGVKVLKNTVSNTDSITKVGAVTQRYYIYYAANGTLTLSSTEWSLEPGEYGGEVPVCTVYWNAVAHIGILEEERHQSWRDLKWHHWAHDTIGARYSGAHTADGLNISNPGANQYATFSISGGNIYDEDLDNAHGVHTTGNIFYHHTDGTMIFEKGVTAPYKLAGGIPQYDNGTGLANKTASNTTGYFVTWVYATNKYDAPKIAFVVGQDTDGAMTLAEAQSAALPSLPVKFIVEWKLIWKMIFRYGAGNVLTWISNTDYRNASSLPSGQVVTGTTSATSVSFSATGNLASSNVQAALEELDTEKAALVHGHASDLGATFDGGGSVLVAGKTIYRIVPFNCTLTGWTIIGAPSGTVSIDVKKSTYANFPTTASIAASAKPNLSSSQKNIDTTLVGWTPTVTAGEILEFVVEASPAPASVTWATVSLQYTRSA